MDEDIKVNYTFAQAASLLGGHPEYPLSIGMKEWQRWTVSDFLLAAHACGYEIKIALVESNMNVLSIRSGPHDR